MSASKIGSLSARKTIFFLCDVQEKFRFMNFFSEFVKNTNKLLTAGKIFQVPLIVSEQNPEKLGKTVAEFDVGHALGKFPKTKFSMIIPQITEKLKEHSEIDTIVLMGLETHICVEQTSMDLLSSGKYSVHIAADCVLSRSSEDRSLALNRLRDMGCIISSSENIIFKLLKDKEHPKFNDVRKLVTEPSAFTGLTFKL